MATARLWAITPIANVPTAQAALDALGRADMAASFAGLFPLGAPQVAWFGLQGTPALVAQVRAALAPVPQVIMAAGPIYGAETDESPGVAQEGDITAGSEPLGTAKHSRRAALKKASKALGFGLSIPADVSGTGTTRTTG